MKHFQKILLMLCLFGIAAPLNTSMAQNKAKKENLVVYVNFHCNDCVKRLDKYLPFEKGVINYKSNLEEKTVTIEYATDKTSPEKIKEAITKRKFVVADSYSDLMKKTAASNVTH